MKTSEELRNLLNRIDHKGYPAYKDTKGQYQLEPMCCPLTMCREIRLRLLPRSVFTSTENRRDLMPVCMT